MMYHSSILLQKNTSAAAVRKLQPLLHLFAFLENTLENIFTALHQLRIDL